MPVWRLICPGSCVELVKHQLFIGRDDDCDISIKHKGIDIRHAVLNHDQRLGVFRLTDLGSSHGTYVNGESVGEESVPLYVGTRIMFGKSPDMWCVEVGEASVKPYISGPPPSQHTAQPYHSVPPSPYSDPYSPPSSHPPPLSHSFLPPDRNSPAHTPGSGAGKSYFGDPTPLADGRGSSFQRGNESFEPLGGGRAAQVNFSDKDSSTSLANNRTSTESRTDTSRVRDQTEDTASASQESVRDLPTRARTLYGQPSWWGDGSDTFSTPPSQRELPKPDPKTPTDPLIPSMFNMNQTSNRDDASSQVASIRQAIHDSDESALQMRPREYTQSATKFFISIDSDNTESDQSEPAHPAHSKALERDNPSTHRAALRRRGSYEIPSEELDCSLSRPIIDPDSPRRGRRSEVFVVDLGGQRGGKQSPRDLETRVLFSEERLVERDKSRVKLAFRETEPIISSPELTPTTETQHEHESDIDPELEFMTPRTTKLNPGLRSPQMSQSLLSERGDVEGIGDPVTSSTPISMTSSSESQLMSPLPPPPVQGDTPGGGHKKGRRRAWNVPQQSLDPAIIQILNDVTQSIESNLEQAFSQAGFIREILSKHSGNEITPLAFTEDLIEHPELDTASQGVVSIVTSLKRIEAKVKNFSQLYGSNSRDLQEFLTKLKAADSSGSDVPEAPTRDQGVMKGSFETEVHLFRSQNLHTN